MKSSNMIRIAVYSTLAIATVSIAALISNQSNDLPAPITPQISQTPTQTTPAIPTPQTAKTKQVISVESAVVMVWQDNKTKEWKSRTIEDSEIPPTAK